MIKEWRRPKDILFLAGMFLLVISTILVGAALESSGTPVRRWYWDNAWILAALVACALFQQKVGLPSVSGKANTSPFPLKAFLAGAVFGLLDVIAIKVLQHPQPYESLPPFLQPFPYSLLLYPAGALEIGVTYRLVPLTLLLGLNTLFINGKWRMPILIVIGILSSLIEPILQFPSAALWVILYATLTGIAMNALEYYWLVKNGFGTSLLVRLGHYLVWHILLGIYVEWFELS
jgi:hypothetical protein